MVDARQAVGARHHLGRVAGLGTITPASGFVLPWHGVVIGLRRRRDLLLGLHQAQAQAQLRRPARRVRRPRRRRRDRHLLAGVFAVAAMPGGLQDGWPARRQSRPGADPALRHRRDSGVVGGCDLRHPQGDQCDGAVACQRRDGTDRSRHHAPRRVQSTHKLRGTPGRRVVGNRASSARPPVTAASATTHLPAEPAPSERFGLRPQAISASSRATLAMMVAAWCATPSGGSAPTRCCGHVLSAASRWVQIFGSFEGRLHQRMKVAGGGDGRSLEVSSGPQAVRAEPP